MIQECKISIEDKQLAGLGLEQDEAWEDFAFSWKKVVHIMKNFTKKSDTEVTTIHFQSGDTCTINMKYEDALNAFIMNSL